MVEYLYKDLSAVTQLHSNVEKNRVAHLSRFDLYIVQKFDCPYYRGSTSTKNFIVLFFDGDSNGMVFRGGSGKNFPN